MRISAYIITVEKTQSLKTKALRFYLFSDIILSKAIVFFQKVWYNMSATHLNISTNKGVL